MSGGARESGRMSGMTPDEMNVKIGEFIRARREERGWSRLTLARMMRDRSVTMTQMTLLRSESGERPFRLHEAQALGDLLGCKVDDILANAEPERGNYLITVAAFEMTEWQCDALFTRVADAAHARDEQVTCSVGPLTDENEF